VKAKDKHVRAPRLQKLKDMARGLKCITGGEADAKPKADAPRQYAMLGHPCYGSAAR
jgi:hypothetical protein